MLIFCYKVSPFLVFFTLKYIKALILLLNISVGISQYIKTLPYKISEIYSKYFIF